MIDEAISPLRRRMIEDMTIRKLAPETQAGYFRTIKSLATFLGRSPDSATVEDIRRFQLYLAQRGAQTHALNHIVSALMVFLQRHARA
jgi:integrase/recombinase XerD